MSWYGLPLNPEPWTVGPLSLGRKAGKVFPILGKDGGLVVYQEAVREEMAARYPAARMVPGHLQLEFYLWRQLDTYTSVAGRAVQRHVADVTNMQKALEDALQGVLYENDREVKDVHTVVVEQGREVEPFILIHARAKKDTRTEYIAQKRQLAIDAWPESPKLFTEPERGTFELGF